MKHDIPYDVIIDANPNALIMINQAGLIVFTNRATERLFGYQSEQLIDQPIEILIPERYRPNHPGHRNNFFTAPALRAMGAGRELFGLKNDGSEFPIEIGLTPVEMPDGLFILSSIIDISERKKLENLFRLAMESSPNAMVMADSTGEIILINKKTETLFGYTREELIGQAIEILVPEKLRAEHPAKRNEYNKSPAPRAMGAGRELFGQKKDGSEFPIEIGLTPVETPEGPAVVSAILDITQRKQAQEQLDKRNEEVEQFVYTVSHDLKTPIVTTMGFLKYLHDDLDEGNYEKARDSLDRIRKAAEKMNSLIQDLLQFSRVGYMEIKYENIDLNQLMEGVIASFQEVIKEKNIKITLQDDLGKIYADGARATQVFENLVGNAIKYGSDNPDPEIKVGIQKSIEREHIVYVSDNGTGMSPEYYEKIFQLFHRLDVEKEGTGVGLAIVKKIMELHHGTVWVKSDIDQGAKFFLQFPTREALIGKL